MSPETKPDTQLQGRTIDAVMFDMDGTLVNSRHVLIASYHQATEGVLGYAAHTGADEIENIIQLSGKDAFPLLAGNDPEKTVALKEAFNVAYEGRQHDVGLFPGTKEMLEALRGRDVPAAIATSKARIRLTMDLKRTGIDSLLEVTITADDVKRAKPDPEPILAGADRLGIDPARILYVGDGPNDIRAARDAGAQAAGVEFGFHPAECRAEQPDYMLAGWDDLLGLPGLR